MGQKCKINTMEVWDPYKHLKTLIEQSVILINFASVKMSFLTSSLHACLGNALCKALTSPYDNNQNALSSIQQLQ